MAHKSDSWRLVVRPAEAVLQVQEFVCCPDADQPQVFSFLLGRAVAHYRHQLPDTVTVSMLGVFSMSPIRFAPMTR